MSTLTSYRLSYDGDSKSLADWGITDATLKLSAGGDDVLTFTCAESITSAPRFTAFKRVQLLDQDGNPVFYGTVYPDTRDGFTILYRCRGADWWLEATPIKQEWKFVVGTTLTPKNISYVRFGNTLIGDQVDEIITQVADAGFPVDVDSSILPEHHSPEDLQRGIYADEAVKKALAWDPWAIRAWDYSGTPVLKIRSVLRPEHAYGLPSNATRRTVNLSQMSAAGSRPKFKPLYDRLISSFKVYFIAGEEVAVVDAEIPGVDAGKTVVVNRYDDDEATPTLANGSFAKKELTIELRRGAWNGGARDSDEVKPENLAKRLGAPYFQLWLAMNWATTGKYCDFSIVPGELWDAADADPLYASAGAVCQVVTHQLRTGQTTVQCGAPDQLGFWDPAVQLRLRRIPTPQEAGQQQYGFKPKDGEETGTEVQIAAYQKLPDGLHAKYVTVRATVDDGVETMTAHGMADVGGLPTHRLFETIGVETDA